MVTVLLLLLFGVCRAKPGESENTLSLQRPQPHTTNPLKKEKDKTVRDKKRKKRFYFNAVFENVSIQIILKV